MSARRRDPDERRARGARPTATTRREAAAGARRAGRRPALGPAGHRSPLGVAGALGRGARRRPGRCSIFVDRGGHRADPQPARRRSCSAACGCRAASRSRAVYLGFFAVARSRVGVLLANPVSDQVTTLQRRRPAITDSANQRLADVQDYFDRKGINVEVKQPGETALQTLQERSSAARHDRRRSARDLLTTVVTGGLRADPRLRALDLHAHLRRADRRARAPRDAAGRRHAARTTIRRASCARSPATSAASCCSASRWASAPGSALWIFGVARRSSPTARPTRSPSASSSA